MKVKSMSSKPKSTTSQRKEAEPKSTASQQKYMRDDFKDSVKDILCQRAGNRCCLCRKLTSGPTTDPEKAYNIGVAAHIIAADYGGPRYDETLTSEQRSNPENGIWLCCNCHKLVDSDQKEYTVEKLKQLKKEGEERARKASGAQEPNISELTSKSITFEIEIPQRSWVASTQKLYGDTPTMTHICMHKSHVILMT